MACASDKEVITDSVILIDVNPESNRSYVIKNTIKNTKFNQRICTYHYIQHCYLEFEKEAKERCPATFSSHVKVYLKPNRSCAVTSQIHPIITAKLEFDLFNLFCVITDKIEQHEVLLLLIKTITKLLTIKNKNMTVEFVFRPRYAKNQKQRA